MSVSAQALGKRIAEVRKAAGISQAQAAQAIEVSQPTYHRIEVGERVLKGAELVQLADLFGVRVSLLAGVPAIEQRVRFAARTSGASSAMASMRQRLHEYLELDAYLTDHGIYEGPCCDE